MLQEKPNIDSKLNLETFLLVQEKVSFLLQQLSLYVPRPNDSSCTPSFPGILLHGEVLESNFHISMSSKSWEISSSLKENLPACCKSCPDQSLPRIVFPGGMTELSGLDWSYFCPVLFLWQHQDTKIIPSHQPQALKEGERIGQVKVSFSPNSWKKMGTSRSKLELQDGLYHFSQGSSFSTERGILAL